MNMRGLTVKYGGQQYMCISMSHSFVTVTSNGFTYKNAPFLELLTINSDGKIELINDFADEFTFSKED